MNNVFPIVPSTQQSIILECTFDEAVEAAHEQGIPHFFKVDGRMYIAYRLGDQYVIVDHENLSYHLSPRIRRGVTAMTPYAFQALGILLRMGRPLRGWMEYCATHEWSPVLAESSMQELYQELKRFY